MGWVCAGPDGDPTPKPPLRLMGSSLPALPAWPVVNDLLPLAQRLELVQTLWDSIAAEQVGPDLNNADRQLIDQRLERLQADGDLGLDADAVLLALEQFL